MNYSEQAWCGQASSRTIPAGQCYRLVATKAAASKLAIIVADHMVDNAPFESIPAAASEMNRIIQTKLDPKDRVFHCAEAVTDMSQLVRDSVEDVTWRALGPGAKRGLKKTMPKINLKPLDASSALLRS